METTQWDRKVSGHTFLPPLSPLIMMSPHCTTASYEFRKLFNNAIQVLLDIPRRAMDAKPRILVELGVGPQLASAGTPSSGRWECAGVRTEITSVEHVLRSICLSFMTHHSLHTQVYFTSGYCATQTDFNTQILFRNISMFLKRERNTIF